MAVYKLGDICEIIVGKDMPEDKSNIKTTEYFVPIVSNSIDEKQVMGYCKKTEIEKETISVSARGTVGHVSFWSVPIYPIVRLLVLCANNDLVKSKYLFYKLKTQKFYSTGAVQKQITKPMIFDHKINAPSLVEQQKIIDLIEPHEQLFLKYSNCVRIDGFENGLEDLKHLIDIVKPIEKINEHLNKMVLKILEIVKNIPNKKNKVKIGSFFKDVRNTKRKTNQISAKVISSDSTGLISSLEDKGTYRTNTFFCNKGTFVFSSIRTYLKKWAIIPFDADVNGTLFQFEIIKNITPLLKYLQSNDSWSQFDLLSKGTKMPVISKSDFKNILINQTTFNIEKIDQIIFIINKLIIKTETLKQKIINLLIR